MTAAIPRGADAVPSPGVRRLRVEVALLLDVDGTLLDIAVTPFDVVVQAILREILGDLMESAGGAVALVSGRPIASLDGLSGLCSLAIGGHGAEMRVATGEPVIETSTATFDKALRRELKRLADVDPRLSIEDKAHSLALHYRLAPEREAFLKVAVREVVASEPKHDVEVLFGKQVVDGEADAFEQGLRRP